MARARSDVRLMTALLDYRKTILTISLNNMQGASDTERHVFYGSNPFANRTVCSYAPLSNRPSWRENPTPRWSLASGRPSGALQPAGSPASWAGLVNGNACVGVGPPLFASLSLIHI